MAGRRRVGAAMALLAAALAAPPSVAAASEDPFFAFQWNLAAIQAPSAWPISRGAGVTVAVLDSGVAYEDRGPYRRVPDIAAARLRAGRDFVDDDAHPDDVPPAGGRRSHGTLMAGIIAATANNAIAGAGVAPAATIMPVRVLEPDLSGSARAIAAGLRYAADHGAAVANVSIAGPAPSRVLERAVRYATTKGVTVVAAAGNDGRSSVSWPAAYPQVIAVGATARDGTRASYSNYGRALDLVAPGGAGERIDTGYGPPDGISAQSLKGAPAAFCICFSASSSAAAAEVSGVAALLIGSGRARSPGAVRAALMSSARDLGAPGRDAQYGAGLVQARNALQAGRPTAAVARPAHRSRMLHAWWAAGIAAVVLAAAGAGRLLRDKRGRR